MKKEEMLDLAIAQFIGFHEASIGSSILDLVSSMGLKREEWEKIKRSEQQLFSENEIEEINNYFK